MSAKFAPITTVAGLRATTHARPALALYGLLELRRATDRRATDSTDASNSSSARRAR